VSLLRAPVRAVLVSLGRKVITLRRIPRSEGRPYLERYGRGDQEAQIAQDLGTGKWRFRLHHFVGPDDAGHHNHPFEWALSIVLWRSYTEEVLVDPFFLPGCGTFGWIETRRVRFFNWIPRGKYHRIVELHGNVWTLFITGPRVSSWGFWVPGRGHIPFDQYEKGLEK
jgi:hypothetical protein